LLFLKTQKIQGLEFHKQEMQKFLKNVEIDNNILKNGLSSDRALELSRIHGLNMLSERAKVPWYIKLFLEFTSPFALMLWGGSFLCFLSFGLDPNDQSNLFLGLVLFIVISVTGTVTYAQNEKSESIMASFKNFIPPKCSVLRDGKIDQV